MKKIVSIFTILISILLINQTYAKANVIDTNYNDNYQIVQTSDLTISQPITPDTDVNGIISKLIGVAAYICYAAAVIVVLVKGVQFMNAAPEGKAEVKKQLVAVVVGALIVFGIGGILQIVANIVSGLF